MTTGMISPSSFAVLALKALQKSMMLTPAWPSAGPTGGAGVALPPGICSLICPTTFFIDLRPRSGPSLHQCASLGVNPRSAAEESLRSETASKLLHLQEVQFDRGRAPEDRDHHFERVPV